MLMIGGEFDLSSGAMTGAMGMLIIYLVKETGELGGLGFPMLVAIPISLAVALAIGLPERWVVERTGQPSFIITLGTFFALIGLKLGLSKRFVGQIQIGRTDEASDFDFFRPIFAAEWARNEHPFELRDASTSRSARQVLFLFCLPFVNSGSARRQAKACRNH